MHRPQAYLLRQFYEMSPTALIVRVMLDTSLAFGAVLADPRHSIVKAAAPGMPSNV